LAAVHREKIITLAARHRLPENDDPTIIEPIELASDAA
jgi:hypothetical protein